MSRGKNTRMFRPPYDACVSSMPFLDFSSSFPPNPNCRLNFHHLRLLAATATANLRAVRSGVTVAAPTSSLSPVSVDTLSPISLGLVDSYL